MRDDDYEKAMELPAGKRCIDCVHVDRCVNVIGCTVPSSPSCDFYPSRFREAEQPQPEVNRE